MNLAKLTVSADKIGLEVNWVVKTRKYELTKSELLSINHYGGGFGLSKVTFKHNAKAIPASISVKVTEKDWEALRAAFVAAGYEISN